MYEYKILEEIIMMHEFHSQTDHFQAQSKVYLRSIVQHRNNIFNSIKVKYRTIQSYSQYFEHEGLQLRAVESTFKMQKYNMKTNFQAQGCKENEKWRISELHL